MTATASRRTWTIPVLLGLAVIATGCGGPVPTVDAQPTAQQPSTPPPAEECVGYGCSPEQDAELNEGEAQANAEEAQPETNARGNIVKQLGEDAGVGGLERGVDTAVWTVDEVVTDVDCTEPYHSYQPEGHLAAVDLRLSTGPDFADYTSGTATVSSYNFQFIDPAGVTHTTLGTIATYSCLSQSDMFPSAQLGSAQNYEGKVVLDLPATEGTLVFSPTWAGTFTNTGWEYRVG